MRSAQAFPEGKGRYLPAMGWGLRTPGRLTSEDEERETWTAESLRVSTIWRPGIFTRVSGVEAGRKTSAVHVYIGYTIVVRDGNRVPSIWWDLVQRWDQPVQKFQVQLESLIPAQGERWRRPSHTR